MPVLESKSLALIAFAFMACAPAASPAVQKPDLAPAPGPDERPAPAASASAVPSAPASAVAVEEEPPPPGEDKPPFGGVIPAGGKKLSGTRAWAYWPAYGGIGVFDVKQSADSKTTLLEFGSREATFVVATAFTHPAEAPKQLAKGDYVLAPVVTTGVCGIVKELADDRVTVAYLWADEPKTREFPRGELLRLNDKLEFGARVLTKDGDRWAAGTLVHTDKSNAWVAPFDLAQEERKVALKEVRALDVTKRRKKGDAILACTFSTMGCMQTTVVAPKHDGLAYQVALPDDYVGPAGEGAKSTLASACEVGSVP